MTPHGVILPLARDYAAHAGLAIPEAELSADLARRLSCARWMGKSLLVLAALFIRGAAPLLFLGKPAGFGALSPDEKEELLARLQCAPNLLVRGLFLGIKPLLTGLCYGNERFLKSAREVSHA